MVTTSGISFRDEQTPVRDQGPRPTCTAFAVTGAHEWKRGESFDLSEESCLWSANRVAPSVGGAISVAAGLEGISSDGQAREEHWPYGTPAFPASPPAAAAKPANRVKPGLWRSIGFPSLAEIRGALEGGEALILSLRFVVSAWFNASVDGFVDAAPGELVEDGHAVVAIGVTTWSSGPKVIEFKNSWGTEWGDAGYGFLAETYWRRYGKAAYALAG